MSSLKLFDQRNMNEVNEGTPFTICVQHNLCNTYFNNVKQ